MMLSRGKLECSSKNRLCSKPLNHYYRPPLSILVAAPISEPEVSVFLPIMYTIAIRQPLTTTNIAHCI